VPGSDIGVMPPGMQSPSAFPFFAAPPLSLPGGVAPALKGGKQSGLGARFLFGGYDISGDINAIDTISGGPALIDSTDVTQSAHSRIFGLRDGHMANTVFMDAANAHPVLRTLPTSDTLMTALLPPLAIGSIAACLNAKQVGYDPSRSAAGDLLLKTAGEGSGFGLEWCVTLTAGLRTDAAATFGGTLDNGAATSFGAQGYMQLTGFSGTDVTVKVQHSADGALWADLIVFTQVTAAPASQRLATATNATTVNRFLRAATVTSGGFTSATFAVAVNRNSVANVSF
jgi:hypothetical protein